MLTYKIEALMFRKWVDLTDDVLVWTCRFGQIQPNQAGTVMRPADGSIQLNNRSNRYTAYAPGPNIDPTPGPPVRIWVNDQLIFRGYSEGFHNIASRTQHYLTEVPLAGPLYRYSTYTEGVFRRITEDLLTSEAFSLALDELNFPQDQRRIWTGRSRIFSWKLNVDATFGTRKKRASLVDICKVLAQAEVGRIYDNGQGEMVFESRQVRSKLGDFLQYGQKRFTFSDQDGTLDDLVVQDLKMTRIANAIVNSAKSEVDSYVTRGKEDVEFEGGYGNAFEVPARTSVSVLYELKRDDSGNPAFIQSWVVPLVRGEHYTYTNTDEDPILIAQGDRAEVIFPNFTSNTAHTAQVLKLEGDPHDRVAALALAVRSTRSVNKYGLKEVQIPLALIVNKTEVKEHLDWVVQTHDGFDDLTATVDPMRQFEIRYKVIDPNSPYLTPQVSDIVQLTYARFGLVRTNFWVDAVDYHVDQQGSLIIKLGLTDARYTSMWPADNWVIGENTRPGF